MRIIGGEFRGRTLSPFQGSAVRPTADRIRESIFDILSHHLHGSIVLDLFAGTGALGLEALSRGAGFGAFIDQDKKALSVIERNIRSLGLGAQTNIIRWNIANSLDCIRRAPQDAHPSSRGDSGEADRRAFNLVFLDPPYNRHLVDKALSHLHACGALEKGAVVVVEHSPLEPISENPEVFALRDRRKYGQTEISFLDYAAS
ncbi:MAG: 16S rRNA (guanine(966)-N(2))-methyltransferase RsmD [Desulfobacterales bacterium]